MDPTPIWPGIVPVATDETRSFWTGAHEGRFVADWCASCDRYMFPPRGTCSSCQRDDVQAHELARSGLVYSYTTNHNPWWPDQATPMTLALVSMEAPGVRILGQFRSESQLAVGAPVTLMFEAVSEDVAIPIFVPTEPSTRAGVGS